MFCSSYYRLIIIIRADNLLCINLIMCSCYSVQVCVYWIIICGAHVKKLIASIWVVHELEVGIFSVIIQMDENLAWEKKKWLGHVVLIIHD